ncbi:hypothetical protein DFH08DRAFT_881960 [Mycena albidolilacea]|uniref:Secreted protein n=1 Tax=Mycena albidolilacea TaxID=1033008 RepID=A0AAD6ZNG0_9AGAR|nr:hypothetical protein DFH08DRAFT_881960 [Mycena albidolilacea]
MNNRTPRMTVLCLLFLLRSIHAISEWMRCFLSEHDYMCRTARSSNCRAGPVVTMDRNLPRNEQPSKAPFATSAAFNDLGLAPGYLSIYHTRQPCPCRCSFSTAAGMGHPPSSEAPHLPLIGVYLHLELEYRLHLGRRRPTTAPAYAPLARSRPPSSARRARLHRNRNAPAIAY